MIIITMIIIIIIIITIIIYNKMISNVNRTEWSPIRSVIIRVINKIGRPRVLVMIIVIIITRTKFLNLIGHQLP